MRIYWQCSLWARLLFFDNIALQRSWGTCSEKGQATLGQQWFTPCSSFRKNTSLWSCLGISHRQWCISCNGPCSNNFQSTPPCLSTLVLSPYSRKRPKPAAKTPLFVGRTDPTKNQFTERYTLQLKLDFIFHLLFAWNNTVINLSLFWSYFFIGLLWDIILYAIGLRNIITN